MNWVQAGLNAVITDLNKYLTPNFVHTLQFVSIDDNDVDRLVWRSMSVDAIPYKNATIDFTGYNHAEQTISKTLVLSDYLQGPYWYDDLGSSKIDSATKNEENRYQFEDHPHERLRQTDSGAQDYSQLLQSWKACLKRAFGPRGATMWVSQPHAETNNRKIVSSVFVVFNESITETLMRFGASKRMRDFIIGYLIETYKDVIVSQFRIIEQEFAKILSHESRNVYVGPQISRQLKSFERAIQSSVPLLITGETGTGKKAIARTIHRMSKQRSGTIEFINCAQYAGDSRQFQSKVADPHGPFTHSPDGTLVFDNIHQASMDMQSVIKLLVDEKTGVSSTHAQSHLAIPRLLFTSSPNLHERLVLGTFDEDLYYRIYTFDLSLPPLRARKSEFHAITSHIMAQLAASHPVHPKKSLTEDALEELRSYEYPGNYLELVSILTRAYLLCPPDQSMVDAELIFY